MSGGSLVDRGPDSHKVIEFCRNNNIKGVLGNHDDSIINHWKRMKKDGHIPSNLEKQRTLSQLTQEDIDYLESLPYIHVMDDMNLILVHGGVQPNIPLYQNTSNVCRLQMVHPNYPGKTRWFGADADQHSCGKTEEESRKDGWTRWYESYDHKQDVIFGHSSFYQPMIHSPSDNVGKCIGIDTGSSFGGCLTACVYSNTNNFFFISIKNKKVYCKSTSRQFWEA